MNIDLKTFVLHIVAFYNINQIFYSRHFESNIEQFPWYTPPFFPFRRESLRDPCPEDDPYLYCARNQPPTVSQRKEGIENKTFAFSLNISKIWNFSVNSAPI